MTHTHKAKWIAAFACLLVFLAIAFSLDALQSVDEAVYNMVYDNLASSFATAMFTFFSALASPIVLVAFCFVLILLMPHKEYRIPMMINLGIGILLNLGIKHLVERIRPAMETALVVETGYSFPSGHTMAATCFYGFLIFLIHRSEIRPVFRRILTMLLSLIILMICVSRIYLGAHFFTDVLAGFCLSLCLLVVNTSLVSRYFGHPEIELKKEAFPERLRLLSSFRYAFEGIVHGLKTERNMVVHFAVMLLVIVFGAVLGISTTEWMICLILFGLVLTAELLNTAIEIVVDIVMPDIDPRAKAAKDTAAGAVLIVSIVAAAIGLIIFAPKLLGVIASGLYVQGGL